jgi:hypothetical protein
MIALVFALLVAAPADTPIVVVTIGMPSAQAEHARATVAEVLEQRAGLRLARDDERSARASSRAGSGIAERIARAPYRS